MSQTVDRDLATQFNAERERERAAAAQWFDFSLLECHATSRCARAFKHRTSSTGCRRTDGQEYRARRQREFFMSCW